MSISDSQIVILNSFDRSGSSAISRSLLLHPKIELLFQPFNGGSIRKKMNLVFSDQLVSDEDEYFFSELNQGRLWREYIHSIWFDNYSSTKQIVPGKVNLIKTTLNHLTINWIQNRFPKIAFWGIWRDPFDVLASLIRNDFYRKWFYGAERELAETVVQNQECFAPEFVALYALVENNPVRAMAYIIAVRSYFYFAYLKTDHVLNYQKFRQNTDTELNKFTNTYFLEEFSWSNSAYADLNVTGATWSPGRNYRDQIPVQDMQYVRTVFRPLFRLMSERFGNSEWTSDKSSAGCQSND